MPVGEKADMSIAKPLLLRLLLQASVAAVLVFPSLAGAIPLFARQTGFSCATCHFGGNFPELTKTGRDFKLRGYTLGERQTIPLAGMLMASATKVASHAGYDSSAFPRDGELVPEQVSLFTGGRINDNFGAFVQWTYDGVGHHSSIDNADFRFADKIKVGGKDLIYGVTLNNSPTVQDIFNTTPVWGFPYAGPAGPPVTTLIEEGLAQQVAGLGVYADYASSFYGEIAGYRTADKAFSVLRAGTDRSADATLKGFNPYWRFAYHSEGNTTAWEVGTYGLSADLHVNNLDPSTPTSRYRDYALDGQYQFIDGKNRWSAQATWIHEKVTWDPSVGASNGSDRLDSWRVKGSYMYDNKVGGSLGFFGVNGDSDAGLYGGSSNTSSPNSQGYIVEAVYKPIQNIKLVIQYTGYLKYFGSRANYDPGVAPGTSRDARDNNTLYLLAWIML